MNASRLLKHFDRISEAPDAIPKLRKFILDLAVRGKLVEQDASDEPALALLKKIDEEKARQLRAGEIGKQRALPLLGQDEIPFPAPINWEWVRIRQVTVNRGQTVPKQAFTYLDVTSINKEAGRIEEPQVLEAAGAPSRARKVVEKGDVIYSCVRPYLLNIAVIDRDIRPAPIASTAFAVLNAFGLVLPQYLWIVLRSPMFVEQVEGKMRGQAYPAINDGDFALLPIPLPPLAEQHRIVAKVDELMELCSRLEAAQGKREVGRDRLFIASSSRIGQPGQLGSEDFQHFAKFHLGHLAQLLGRASQINPLRQSIHALAIAGAIAEQDNRDEPAESLLARIGQTKKRLYSERKIPKPKSLPEFVRPASLPPGWSWAQLGDLCFQVSDGPHHSPAYVSRDVGVPFLSTRNIRLDGFDLDRMKFISKEDHERFCARVRPERGDILYTKGGTTGIARVNDLDFEFSVWVHVAVLRIARDMLDAHYLALALNSPFCYAQSQAYTQGISNFDLGLTRMIKILIPIPPLNEQRRIVTKTNELLALCDRLEEQLSSQQEMRTCLLDAVLTETLAVGA